MIRFDFDIVLFKFQSGCDTSVEHIRTVFKPKDSYPKTLCNGNLFTQELKNEFSRNPLRIALLLQFF